MPQPSANPPEDLPPIRAVAIIPARLGSKRLPRKMLLRETGGYLFEHTAKAVARAQAVERVVVATDAGEIAEAAAEVGVEAVLTRTDHPSGTDRVCEAWRSLAEGSAGEAFQVVLNVQGDEPEIDAGELTRLVELFADPAVEIATLAGPVGSEDEARSTSAVKVVCDQRGDALYFSRARIPNADHAREGAASADAVVRRHLGVYAFRPEALLRFCALPTGRLERIESLEQLRWLEAGGRMRVLEVGRVPPGIDTREDYEAFVRRCREGVRGNPEGAPSGTGAPAGRGG